jgi:hypothetical protein
MASESALTDFSRPTKRGATMWGNTTMSLSGRRGKVGLGGCGSSPLKNFGIVTIVINYLLIEV